MFLSSGGSKVFNVIVLTAGFVLIYKLIQTLFGTYVTLGVTLV